MRALAISSASIAAAACALCGMVALSVRAAGQAATARRELAFTFPGPTRQLADALSIATNNGRYVTAIVVGCLAVGLTPAVRPLVDAGLAALLVLNAVVIGFAFGAYGFQLVRALAVHGTLELAGFSLAGGAYLHARTGVFRRDHLAAVAIGALALLMLASFAESWLALGVAP